MGGHCELAHCTILAQTCILSSSSKAQTSVSCGPPEEIEVELDSVDHLETFGGPSSWGTLGGKQSRFVVFSFQPQGSTDFTPCK